MYKIFLIVLLFVSVNVFSQLKEKSPSNFSDKLNQPQSVKLSLEHFSHESLLHESLSHGSLSANKFYVLKNQSLVKDSNNLNSNRNVTGKSRKSPGLAFIYSLFVDSILIIFVHYL